MIAMNSRNFFAPSMTIGRTAHELSRRPLEQLFEAALHGDVGTLRSWREESDALGRRMGRANEIYNSFFIPAEYLARDLTAGSGSGGGHLVATELDFASGLFGTQLIGTLDLRPMPLEGNIALATASSTAGATSWMSNEASSVAGTDPAFAQRTGAPRTVGCYFTVSRSLSQLMGLPGWSYIANLSGAKLAEAASTALVNGSGAAGEPTGLLQVAGTTSVSGASLGWSGVRDMLAGAEGYTASGLRFVAGVTAAKLLRAREKASGSGMVMSDGRIDGVPVVVSRCMPADALLLACWPTVTMATWGTPELTITPLASPGAFQSGKIGIRLLWTVDFLADQPAAVAKAVSIT